MRLETGDRQPGAIRLYERSGYRHIPPFGPYVAWSDSVCFEKPLRDGARLTHAPRPSPARPLEQAGLQGAGAAACARNCSRSSSAFATPPFRSSCCSPGVDGAGKGETVNLLHEWMDPRWLHTHAYGEPSDEERERPEHWRFWRDLPPKGEIGILMNAWYAAPIDRRAHRLTTAIEFRRELQTDRAARAAAHRRRRADPEVHDAPRARHAACAPQGARTRSADSLAGHRRAMAPGAVVRRTGRGRGHGGAADRREPGAVDAGGRIRRAASQPGGRAQPSAIA